MLPQGKISFLQNVNMKTHETVRYSSKSVQFSSMTAKTWKVIDKCVAVREHGSVKVPVNMEVLKSSSNYMMYQNLDYSNKVYYAFIERVDFVGPEVCEVYFKIDVLQTYMYDMDVRDCYVEREHVDDDSRGLHHVDEGLTVGNIKAQNPVPLSLSDIEELCIILVLSGPKFDVTSFAFGKLHSGIFSKLSMYAYGVDDDGTLSLNLDLKAIEDLGHTDAIVNMFMMPRRFVSVSGGDFNGGLVMSSTFSTTRTSQISVPDTQISNYTIKNKKLYTYPYFFLRIMNNTGEVLDVKTELGYNPREVDFVITCDVSQNPVMMLNLVNHNGMELNYENALTLTGFPSCASTSSYYREWLARNSVSNITAIAGSALGIVGGIASGNPLILGGGVLGAMNTIGQFHEASIMPPSPKGNQGGQHNIGRGTMTFYFYTMGLDRHNVEIIDNFFSRFGYKINMMKIPNITGRERWNYVKTTEANIFGDIPNEYLAEIRKIFNDGVTFWHVDSIGSYSLSNNPI